MIQKKNWESNRGETERNGVSSSSPIGSRIRRTMVMTGMLSARFTSGQQSNATKCEENRNKTKRRRFNSDERMVQQEVK